MDARCADAVFYNGKIFTMGKEKRTVRAVAVADGEIVAVGSDAEVKRTAPRGSDKYDLGGKPVVPGFIDSHTHFVQMGVDSLNVELFASKSMEDALGLVKAAAQKTPKGEWVIAANWRESNWENGRFITREDLDRCCPNHPAVAHRICGHLSSVNSLAIEEMSLESGREGVEVDASGRLTGILTESGVGLARSATVPSAEKRARGLRHAMRRAHSLGVTSVQDNGTIDDMRAYREAERLGRLSVRVWFNTPGDDVDAVVRLGITTGFGSQWLKFGGVKIFCDGALGARTALLSEPFADDPGNKGMLVHKIEALQALAEKANRAGLQLVIHAIGDEGIEVALSSIENALEDSPRKEHRHRIEHLELPRDEHLERMRRHKVIASMQPNFVGEWSGIDGMYVERLGSERAERNNPFKKILRSRIKLVFGSDCMPFSPVYGLMSAVNATYRDQRLSVEEAVSAYTRDAAYASFEESSKGTVEVGKLADLAVLSADPFADPSSLRSLKVLKTIVGGNVVYDTSRRR